MVEKDDDLLEKAKAHHDESKSRLRVRKAVPIAEPAPVVKQAAPVTPKVPGPSKKVLRYVVTEPAKVEFGFQRLKFATGKIISDELYGPGMVEKLQGLGVKLKLVEE